MLGILHKGNSLFTPSFQDDSDPVVKPQCYQATVNVIIVVKTQLISRNVLVVTILFGGN